MPVLFKQPSTGLSDLVNTLVRAPALVQQGRSQARQRAQDRRQSAADLQKSIAEAEKTRLEADRLREQAGFRQGLGDDLITIGAFQQGRSLPVAPPAAGSGRTPLERDVNDSIRSNQDLFASREVPSASDAQDGIANLIRAFDGTVQQVTSALGDVQSQGLTAEAAGQARGQLGGRELIAALNSIGQGNQVQPAFETNAQGTVLNQFSGALDESGALAQANIANEQAGGESLVTVNNGDTAPQVGSIPSGFQLIQDPNTGAFRMEPIPGGPAAGDQAERERERATRLEQEGRFADVVMDAIARVEQKVLGADVPVTGLGSLASVIPGTQARDTAALVDTIKANIGFDRLQQMRDASPTGGALGQVSEFENRLLQATLGNLELSQTQDQFLQNLDRVRNIYRGIIHGVRDEQGQLRALESDDVGGGLPQPAVPPQSDNGTAGGSGMTDQQILQQAIDAISQGADRAAVIQRMVELGFGGEAGGQ